MTLISAIWIHWIDVSGAHTKWWRTLCAGHYIAIKSFSRLNNFSIENFYRFISISFSLNDNKELMKFSEIFDRSAKNFKFYLIVNERWLKSVSIYVNENKCTKHKNKNECLFSWRFNFSAFNALSARLIAFNCVLFTRSKKQ